MDSFRNIFVGSNGKTWSAAPKLFCDGAGDMLSFLVGETSAWYIELTMLALRSVPHTERRPFSDIPAGFCNYVRLKSCQCALKWGFPKTCKTKFMPSP